jgi:lysozyme
MSDRGRKTLIELEGSRSLAYRDAAGYLTIGVGHMLTKAELSSGKIVIGDDAVRWGDGLSDEQIGQLFQQDLEVYERAVDQAVDVYLYEPQFDALVSFCFNVGIGRFATATRAGTGFLGSTLLRRINARELVDVPDQMRRWKWSGGRVLRGLVDRREVEIELWEMTA